MYRKCYGTKKHRYTRFDLGEVKEDDEGDEYFRI